MKELGFNMSQSLNMVDRNLFNYTLKIAVPFMKLHGLEEKSIYFKNIHYSDPIKFAKGTMFNQYAGITANHNDNYFAIFRDEFQRLFEAGITKVVVGKSEMSKLSNDVLKSKLSKDFEVYDQQKELVPLSLSQLSAGFVIWIVAVMIAIFVFFLEILHHKCSQAWHKFRLEKDTKITIKIVKLSEKP